MYLNQLDHFIAKLPKAAARIGVAAAYAAYRSDWCMT